MLNVSKNATDITHEQTSKSISFEKSIATRLREFLLTIVALLVLAAAVNSNQLYALWKSQRNSTDLVIPALTSSHQLESQLFKYLDLSRSMQTLKHSNAIAETHELMNSISLKLQDTAFVSTNLEVTRNMRSELNRNLLLLQTSTEHVAEIRNNILKIEDSLTNNANNLTRLQAEFELTLEPHIAHMASSTDDMLLAINKRNSQNNPTSEASASLLSVVHSHKNMIELLLKVTGIIERVIQLSKQRNVLGSAETDAKTRFEISSAAQILSKFNDEELRRKLAENLKAIYTSVIEESGVLHNLASYGVQHKNLNKEAGTQAQIANELSRLVDNIVEIANKNSNEASRGLKNTLLTTIVVSVLTTILIIAITLFINSTIIEKQINHRMRKLTNAVLDIADGNTEKQVDIHGDDEIGKMANALQVFKTNAQELVRSNHELEQFAYAASHDLKSPLRAIENLAQWTLEDAGETLDATSKNNLEKILERAHRLSTLQSELLNYSRAGNQESFVENFNFKDEIDELSKLLDPNNRFSIKLNSQTKVASTHVVPLRQILLNLITNAIKHHDLSHGEVDITVQRMDNRLLIKVHDDGAGIAPKYHGKIFELFQGLQSKDEVEGSGLGLSLIKKLVTHYSGSIYVVSDPQASRGTTFCFDWPLYELEHNQAA